MDFYEQYEADYFGYREEDVEEEKQIMGIAEGVIIYENA